MHEILYRGDVRSDTGDIGSFEDGILSEWLAYNNYGKRNEGNLPKHKETSNAYIPIINKLIPNAKEQDVMRE